MPSSHTCHSSTPCMAICSPSTQRWSWARSSRQWTSEFGAWGMRMPYAAAAELWASMQCMQCRLYVAQSLLQLCHACSFNGTNRSETPDKLLRAYNEHWCPVADMFPDGAAVLPASLSAFSEVYNKAAKAAREQPQSSVLQSSVPTLSSNLAAQVGAIAKHSQWVMTPPILMIYHACLTCIMVHHGRMTPPHLQA